MPQPGPNCRRALGAYVNEARGGALPALEWVMGDEWPRLVLTRPVKAGEELLVDSYTPQLA